MALSPLISITHKHARSISLPSRNHPFIPQFDEYLSRVRSCKAASLSLLSMSNRLGDLKNLHDCTDDVLLLPHIQQAISQSSLEKWADELLDGYLRLLDACSTTRDIFSYTKQNVQELLSALRRKDSDDISSYLTSRRKLKKMINKALKDLRTIKNRKNILASVSDAETLEVFSMLKEVESITLNMFETLLSYVNGNSRHGGWSLVSKLISTRVPNQSEEPNEFEKVDTTLHYLISHKMSNKDDIDQVEAIQCQFGELESSVQILEEDLECLFRRLIKSRVFLLNLLNH